MKNTIQVQSSASPLFVAIKSCLPGRMKLALPILVGILSLATQTSAQIPPGLPFVVTNYTVIHSFDYTNGAIPSTPLLLHGNRLYGTTESGGFINGVPILSGTVFGINPDGSRFEILHTFDWTVQDGAVPTGPLVSIGDGIYGTTWTWGTYCGGTIYGITGIGMGTNSYGKLYDFNYDGVEAFDGVNPTGLILVGNTMYGTANVDGINLGGTVFELGSSGYGILHSFTNQYVDPTSSDGLSPCAPLTDGGIVGASWYCCANTHCVCLYRALYGTTCSGGTNGAGTLFRILMSPDNSQLLDYTVLHHFGGTNADGSSIEANPCTQLVRVGRKLYGAAYMAGNSVIFSINMDGSGYSVLCTIPLAIVNSLTAVSNVLYGTTVTYYHYSDSVFEIPLPETGIIYLHQFGGTYTNADGTVIQDGVNPCTPLTLVRGIHNNPGIIYDVLYGTTKNGGEYAYSPGTVFGLPVGSHTNAVIPIISGVSGGQFFDGAFSFVLTEDANSSWTLYSSSNAVDWTEVGTMTLDDSGVSSFTDLTAGSVSNCFYKLCNGANCSQVIGFEQVGGIVIILTSPTIDVQPEGQSVCAGSAVTFSATAEGGLLNYQWQFNGTNILSATNSAYSITAVTAGNAGNYTVMVSNPCGSITSTTAVLTVDSCCTPVSTNLVSWWKAENNANDSFGVNNGIPQNIAYSTGEVGLAFNFNTNGNVLVPASSTLNVGTGNGFTLEAWINPANVAQRGPLFEWNTGSGTNYWGVHFYIDPYTPSGFKPGALYANIISSSGGWHQIWSPGGTVTTNVFQHVALTYNKASGLATIYCNGVAVAQQSMGSFTPLTSYNLYMGKRPLTFGETYSFAGLLDEASLYSRALSAAEIQAIYNAGSAGKCPP